MDGLVGCKDAWARSGLERLSMDGVGVIIIDNHEIGITL
jgi:hypothetical protein